MKQGFVLDLNQCVGCRACVLACQIENREIQHRQWRAIYAFNRVKLPAIPVYHFSLACNHCAEAPCLRFCPAKAYSRHAATGAVIHDSARCIGCTYCTWTCPYDAPKFSSITGVIEKCNLCLPRLENGLKPACVQACPTGALRFQELELEADAASIAGFTDADIAPGIRIIPLRNPDGPTIQAQLTDVERAHFQNQRTSTHSKIDLRSEWVLLVFTLLSPVLFGLVAASVLGKLTLAPLLFIGLGAAGMTLSSLHLGRKFRAWRALTNVHRSWISREIFFFGLFIAAGTVHCLRPDFAGAGYFAIIAGLAALVSMDAAYSVVSHATPFRFHSASVLLTGLLFAALLAGGTAFWAALLILKTALYAHQKINNSNVGKNNAIAQTLLRIGLGFLTPVGLLIGYPHPGLIGISIVIGEIIDRAEFYLSLDVMHPQLQIERDVLTLASLKKKSLSGQPG